MGDILSQTEIDDLLAQLSAGEINASELKSNKSEKKVKVHDLKGLVSSPRIICVHCILSRRIMQGL
mgnify:CR=1 FL=1